MTTTAVPVAEARRESVVPSLQTFVVVAYLAITAAGLAGVGGRALGALWAITAAVTALTLVMRSPAAYLAFTVSLWLYTPLFRRVLDMHHGFQATNLALAAPVLASSVAILTVIRFFRELRGVLFAPVRIPRRRPAERAPAGVLRVPDLALAGARRPAHRAALAALPGHEARLRAHARVGDRAGGPVRRGAVRRHAAVGPHL